MRWEEGRRGGEGEGVVTVVVLGCWVGYFGLTRTLKGRPLDTKLMLGLCRVDEWWRPTEPG